MKTTIGKCRDNLFVILPKEAAAQLDWDHGDILDVEVSDDGLKVVRAMTKHDHVMEKLRNGSWKNIGRPSKPLRSLDFSKSMLIFGSVG